MSPFCRVAPRALMRGVLLCLAVGCGGVEQAPDGGPALADPDRGVPPVDGAPGGPEPGPAATCEDVVVVNLSQDPRSTDSCVQPGTREAAAACVAERIEAALAPGCQKAFDVFVPGTAAEHGAWKQFNSMFSRDTGRGYLSLQYQDDEFIEGTNFDGAQYDLGVIDASASLRWLLYALQTRIGAEDIRVFGHSKGSHAVALVSEDSEFADIEFFAFAQPGRTDVVLEDGVPEGLLGRPGLVEKLSENLVGITWDNDEVQYYRGAGTNGLPIPERWSYPGYILQNTADGGNPLSFRIDHHNNYGGSYTDGVASNDWRAGEGTIGAQYPYCSTGNSFFGGFAECERKAVRYTPYFWGNDECRDLAFDLMQTGEPGDFEYIGHSGPRGPGCSEADDVVNADFVMVHRIDLGDLNDGDCRYELEVAFDGLDGRSPGGSITVQTSNVRDTGWVTTEGTVEVPIHMQVRLSAEIADTSGVIRDCGGISIADSESYVQLLRLRFTHPATGQSVDRTVIGLSEGSTAFPWPASLSRQNNVAWFDDPNNDDIDIHYSLTKSALMLKGDTDGGVSGTFYKRVHLLD